MAEGLQIQIGANVSSAVQGLNQVQAELQQTGKEAVALSNSVVKATGTLSKLPGSANQANQAITNLNRVVQDAPFGFIGIQNNIGPLVDSFGQLKMSTGSTGSALKALFSSLAGPAGIGLAIAGVTSAITFAIQGFSFWTKGLQDAKDANDELAKSLSLDLVNLTTIVGLAQNTAASSSDRANALKLLNEEYTKYLPNLDKEVISLTNINDKYLEIIDTMLKQAVVKGLQETIAKQVEETAKQIVALQIARERERLELEKGNKEYVKAGQTLNQYVSDSSKRNKTIVDGNLALIEQNKTQQAAIGTTNVYDMMIAGLKDTLMESLQPALKLVGAFKDLNKELKNPPKVEYDFSPIFTLSALTIEEGRQADLFARGNILSEEFRKQLEEGFKELKPIKVPFRISPEIKAASEDFKKGVKANEKELENFVDNINKILTGIQVEGLTTLAQGLGKALAGGDIGESFKAFGEVIAGGLESLGKQLINVAVLAKLTKEALAKLFTNPGLALAVGVGLIAAGSALRTSLNNGIKARALGGPVSGGQPYLVGERGPELFVPQVSGGIVPNNSVGSFMSGRMGDSGRGSVLRGQDIILAYARTQRSQLRVNG